MTTISIQHRRNAGLIAMTLGAAGCGDDLVDPCANQPSE